MKDREVLRKRLKPLLIENCINAKILKEVKADLLKLGILGGTVQDMFTQRITVEQMSDDVLYHLAKSLSRALEKNSINPTPYYMEEEIEEIKRQNKTKLTDEGNELPFTIGRVHKVSHDMYVTFMSAKELVELYNRGRVRYRAETQRNATVIKHGDTLIEAHTINNRSVEEIKKELLEGQFITNSITLNSIEMDTLHYNEKTGELTVSCILDILDGFHRSMAMIRAVAEGDIDYITEVSIRNYSIEKAQKFIIQEDKKNKIDRRFIKYLDKDSKANIVVKKINENDYSDLKGKIATDRKFLKVGRALTLTDVMEGGIDKYFKLETMSDVKNLEEYLVEAFNHIVALYPTDFLNVAESKKTSVLTNEHMFMGYLYILSKVRNSKNWKQKLEETLKGIDFSTNNHNWEKIGLMKADLTKGTVTNLEKYLSKYV